MKRLEILLLFLLPLLFACDNKREVYSPQSFEDLEGHTVCVLEGSIQHDYANKHLQGMNITYKSYTNATDCLLATNKGMVDVFFAADLYAYNEAFHRQHLKVCKIIEEINGPFAFGIKKGNDELTDDVNAFQDSLTNVGELQKIVKRWFNPENKDYHACIVIPPTDGKASQGDKVLRVGISGHKPPAEVLIDNKWTGCEIEVLQLYAASRGYTLHIDCYEFCNLIPALETDKIDIAASTMAINDERKAKINFCNSYTSVHAAFITPDPDFVQTKSLWEQLKEGAYYSFVVENRWKLLVEGFWVTLIVSIASLMLGALLGGVVYWLVTNKRRWLRGIGRTYVNIVRNIPMLVILMMMFYVVLVDTGLPTIVVAIIAFGMQSAAYMSGIYRAGIDSVDKGQREAALAMGFSPSQTFFYFIAPQAIRKSLPVFQNEAVTMLKGTALVGYISLMDLTKASDLIRSSSFEAFLPLVAVSIVYFSLAWVYTTVIGIFIKRL